jgi:hypothetical protein
MDRVPFGARDIPCPRGLHRATYGRLLRNLRQIEDRLARLAWRPLRPQIRHRLDTQLRHRRQRIRERLGLAPSRPPSRQWVRVGVAAAFLHLSTRTLCRWTNQGKIACHRAWWGGHRYFHRQELLQARARRRV